MTDGGLIDERLRCRGCGQVHAQARIVSLPDGRQVGNYSEEHRRYWEANWVLKRYRSKRTRQAYLDEIERIRGFEAKMELREEMLKIWNWKKGQK